MRRPAVRRLATAAGLLVASLGGPTLGQETPVAFTGAEILPISSPPIEDGVLVVHRGRITAVGGSWDADP